MRDIWAAGNAHVGGGGAGVVVLGAGPDEGVEGRLGTRMPYKYHFLAAAEMKFWPARMKSWQLLELSSWPARMKFSLLLLDPCDCW